MSPLAVTPPMENLAPERFRFWTPPSSRYVQTGPEQRQIRLPQVPLPLKRDGQIEAPADQAIGEGLYDYLRQFPDCVHNATYAQLLRDAYPHLLADLAAHAVMLDAKEVDPPYILRKLTALKILCLVEPGNQGLLHQLSRGFYDLALTFSELPHCRRHLLEAMRYGLDLARLDPANLAVQHVLADIDMLFCDYPSAAKRWQRLLVELDEGEAKAEMERRIAVCRARKMPHRTRVDDLEDLGRAMQLCAARSYGLAKAILERLEEDVEFMEEFASAEFYYLLGVCRRETDDHAGAIAAFHQALESDPGHQPSQDALAEL